MYLFYMYFVPWLLQMIEFHSGMQVPRSVRVKEHFESPTEASPE